MPVALPEIADLLADCLALWQIEGRVVADGAGLAIETAAGRFALHRAAAPARWRIDTPARRAAARGPRMAASIAAALLVLQAAMHEAERGRR